MPRKLSKFLAATGVYSVRILDEQPSFITRKKPVGAKANGVRYERKALDKLESIAPSEGKWVRSPWIEFCDQSGKRWCQPDAFFMGSQNIVFEIKYKHCAEAWFQLWRLYVPVLEHLYGVPFCGVEVVKWLDPAIQFPERFLMLREPFQPQPKVTGIHVWNPQRDRSFGRD